MGQANEAGLTLIEGSFSSVDNDVELTSQNSASASHMPLILKF